MACVPNETAKINAKGAFPMTDVINDMIIISSGQSVSDLNVGKDGVVEVENGGTLATVNVNQGGWLTIFSGGTAIR